MNRHSTSRQAGAGQGARCFGTSLTAGATVRARVARCGLTLIELLVVIIILTTLVSAAIPLLAPTNDDRRLREATRGVNAFITGAQMKAIQLQRPVGVAIKRLSQDTNSNDDNAVSLELYYVEQPAPYRGFDRTSSAMVARHPDRSGYVLVKFVSRGTSASGDALPAGWDADLIPQELLRPNDVIEIDGTRYALQVPLGRSNVTVSNQTGTYVIPTGAVVQMEAVPLNDTGQMLNIEFDANGDRIRDFGSSGAPVAPFWTSPAPYKILRQPTPTSNEPFQLPNGTAIDLRASGVGNDDYFYVPSSAAPTDFRDNREPIVIMFAPEGRVSRVRYAVNTSVNPNDPLKQFDEPVTDNVFLLVGRRENAPPPVVASDGTLDSDNLPAANAPGREQQLQDLKEAVNWLRSESRWIAIGSQSGRVVTVDNAFVDVYKYAITSPDDTTRNSQIKASREFAREMTQAGGR